jgi:hypothetical protein
MQRRTPFLAVVILVIPMLAACGSATHVAPPGPLFTTTPGTQVAEGATYTYRIAATDPGGTAVSFALTTAPTGAALSGNTITWTPTPAQSRIANKFRVTATAAAGDTSTQSWAVTPNGTVNLSWIDTYWKDSGPLPVPFDWTQNVGAAAQVAALVPQADGSILVLKGSGKADGTFSIPNVPGGFYWLRIAPLATYWTSSSTFDFGHDVIGSPLRATSGLQNTIFNISASGLDPLRTEDWFGFLTDQQMLDIEFPRAVPVGSTTVDVSAIVRSNIDFSQASAGFLMQFEPVFLGSLNGLALGPELTLSNLSVQNGATNFITGALNASPESSFALSINGSSWAPLFNNAGPTAANPIGSVLTVSAQPFATGRLASGMNSFLGPNLPLFTSASQGIGFGSPSGAVTSCANSSDTLFTLPVASQPPILTDQNFGTLLYGDPFPSAWLRIFSFCQKASLQVPIPSSGATVPFLLVDGASTAVPTAPVAPLVSTVRDLMINGVSLSVPRTINTTAINLSWSPPSSGTPSSYSVQLFILGTQPDGSMLYFPSEKFSTAKTSMTPLITLQAGRVFVLLVTAQVDGLANVESSPNRSGLPIGFASFVSAPVTVGSPGIGLVIHGDASSAERILSPQPISDPPSSWHFEVQRPQ